MKWSFTSIAFVILGLVGLSVIILFEKLTTSNENDYYLLKEITEAAMYDAIDMEYYDATGNLKIVKEKFVENFTRRFAESTLFIGTKYIISFYDIIEMPPKVSLWINTGVEDFQLYNQEPTDFNVDNTLTAILEYVDEASSIDYERHDPTDGYDIIPDKITTKNTTREVYYSSVGINAKGSTSTTQPLIIPDEIKYKENYIRDGSLKIDKIEYSVVSSMEEVMKAKLKRELSWASAAENAKNGNGTQYYEKINMNAYATSMSIDNVYSYSCTTKEGRKHSDMNCEKYKEYGGYWIHWDGKTSQTGKTEALVKFIVTWAYDEYEYVEK